MRNALTVAGKELRIYFVSPVFYVVTALFMLAWGYVESTNIFFGNQADARTSLNITAFVMILLAPLLTMRLISQEKQQGTIELLMTNPVRDSEVVWGKFIAVV